MSKRTIAFKKMMVLVGMGGTFLFVPFLWDGADVGCVRNSDLTTFYQGVGVAGIESFADSTRNAMGYDTDFDEWVITPTQGFFNGMWNNWIAQQYPLDVEPITANVLRQ
jgi:hypothetical protein